MGKWPMDGAWNQYLCLRHASALPPGGGSEEGDAGRHCCRCCCCHRRHEEQWPERRGGYRVCGLRQDERPPWVHQLHFCHCALAYSSKGGQPSTSQKLQSAVQTTTARPQTAQAFHHIDQALPLWKAALPDFGRAAQIVLCTCNSAAPHYSSSTANNPCLCSHARH